LRTEAVDALASHTKGSAVQLFTEKLKKTESYRQWSAQVIGLPNMDSDRKADYLNYLRTPHEMFARFVDHWFARKIAKDPKGAAGYPAELSLQWYDKKGGRFSDADLDSLEKDFQPILDEIKKIQIRDKYKALPPGDLRKNLDAAEGAGNSPAGNRAPGPGLGINYFIWVPDRNMKPNSILATGYSPTAKDLTAMTPEEYRAMGLHREKEVWDFDSAVKVEPKPLEMPDEFYNGDDIREGTEERFYFIQSYPIRNAGRPKNKPLKRKKQKPQ
jgi:hypothetical protein